MLPPPSLPNANLGLGLFSKRGQRNIVTLYSDRVDLRTKFANRSRCVSRDKVRPQANHIGPDVYEVSIIRVVDDSLLLTEPKVLPVITSLSRKPCMQSRIS